VHVFLRGKDDSMKCLMSGAAVAAACAVLCGCAMMQQGEFDSSGAAVGDAPVTMLALAVHTEYAPDDIGNATDSAAAASHAAASGRAVAPAATKTPDPADIARFVAAFAENFSADLPRLLEQRGVQVHDPGLGIPLLRIHAAATRLKCDDPQFCETLVRIDGDLLDDNGKKAWSFSDWLPLMEMNQGLYDAFYKRLLDRMIKDQAVEAS
jgi:hypothetical protein